MPYIINEETLALLNQAKKTKILETKGEIVVNETVDKILEYNCNINGSTFEGRRKASSYLIGASYKPPIVIDETREIILIPTHSNKNPNCNWIILNSIQKYSVSAYNYVTITFKNGQKLNLKVSYGNFDKQVLRATRLESSLRGRKHKKYL